MNTTARSASCAPGFRRMFWGVMACACLPAGAATAAPAGGITLLPEAEYFVAIDNVCAWPRLVRLPNGEIVAAIYNNVEHGMTCGDVDLWVSADGGRGWSRRSTVSDHADEPEFVRMNHAMGLAQDGSLVVLVSGWSARRGPPTLPVQICISRDQGRTWERTICADPAIAPLVPHGDIVQAADGTLVASLYSEGILPGAAGGAGAEQNAVRRSVTVRSRDNGRTWGDVRVIANEIGEVSLARLRSGRWLAAARTTGGTAGVTAERVLSSSTGVVRLFSSDDEGATWSAHDQPVTLPGQHPASLLELRDGRILLAYGSRITGLYGVGARLSDDGGQTWSRPQFLVGVPGPLDGGYPSTVELDDGSLVTAYYAGPRAQGKARELSPFGMPWHNRYHMGVCIWKPEGFEFIR
jgi:hypothetical protein